MNDLEQRKLQEIAEAGYEFRFNDYLEKGFNLFKQQIGLFIGYAFVMLAITMIMSFIPIVGQIGLLFVAYPLWLGFSIVANKIDRGSSVEFGDFFKGFDAVGQLTILYLVSILAYVAILVVPMMLGAFSMFAYADDPGGANFPFWIFLFFIPIIYLGVAWRWAPMFVYFYKMGFWEAMETSRKIVTKQFWMQLVFALVLGVLAGFGMILLFVGIFVTLPIMACMDYAAFADITRLQSAEEGDEIIDHLVA